MPQRTTLPPTDPDGQKVSARPRHTATTASKMHGRCGIGDLPQELLAEVLGNLQVTDWAQARRVNTTWDRAARQGDVVQKVFAHGLTHPVSGRRKRATTAGNAAQSRPAPLPPFPELSMPSGSDRPDLHLLASAAHDHILKRPPGQATFLGFEAYADVDGFVMPHGECVSIHRRFSSITMQLRAWDHPPDTTIAAHVNDLLPESYIDAAGLLMTRDSKSNRYSWRPLDTSKKRGLLDGVGMALAGRTLRVIHPDGVSFYGLVKAREWVTCGVQSAMGFSISHADPSIIRTGYGLSVRHGSEQAHLIDFARPWLAARTFQADHGMQICAGRVLTDATTMLSLSTAIAAVPPSGMLQPYVLQRWRIERARVRPESRIELNNLSDCQALFSADGSRMIAIPNNRRSMFKQPGMAFDLTQTPPTALQFRVNDDSRPMAIADDGRRAIVGGEYPRRQAARLYMLDGNGCAAAKQHDGAGPAGERRLDAGNALQSDHRMCIAKSASFTPTGTRVATINTDNQAHLWDVTTAKPFPLQKLSLSPVERLAFLTDWKLTGVIRDSSRRPRLMLWDYSSLPPRPEPERCGSAEPLTEEV